jgi:hypothetical protein
MFIIVEVILAIAFGTCNFKKASNAAAVLEWAVAFIFSFYVFSFYVDLFPAVRTRHTGAGFKSDDPAMRRAADRQMEEAGSDRYLNGPMDGPMDRHHDRHPSVDGYANGGHHSNGYTNGTGTNGYSNGYTNGHTDGYTNGNNHGPHNNF